MLLNKVLLLWSKFCKVGCMFFYEDRLNNRRVEKEEKSRDILKCEYRHIGYEWGLSLDFAFCPCKTHPVHTQFVFCFFAGVLANLLRGGVHMCTGVYVCMCVCVCV